MNILWFNLAMDEDHRLGFAVKWVRAVAERVASVHVITMRRGRATVPANVTIHSLGKEKGFSEPRRAFEFYRLLLRTLRTERIDVCFSHMNPLFTVLAAPLLRVKGIPAVTWYAHRQLTTMVKLAHLSSDTVVSSVASSYPYKTDRLRLLGQAIDTDLFRPQAGIPDPGLVLNVGRLSPIKDLHTLVEAVQRLKQRNIEVRCVLIGEAPEVHASYPRSLRARISELHLDDAVHFEGLLPQKDVASWCQRCEVHVNLSPTGLFDKAALEAAACGRPGIVSNEAFREILGDYAGQLLFRHGDAADLACKIERLLALPIHERNAIGSFLRARVLELHGFDRLIDRLTAVLQEATGRRA